VVAVAALALGGTGLLRVFAGPADPAKRRRSSPSYMRPNARPAPVATPARQLLPYAVAVPRVTGLSTAIPPGANIDLWVTWAPTNRMGSRVELLTRRAVVKRIVPPLTPRAPETALLLVPPRTIRKLVSTERFGSLSIAPPHE
jgi:hypothetical protein